MKKAFRVIIFFLLVLIIFKPREVLADGDFQIDDTTLVRYTGTASQVVIPDNVTVIDANAFAKNTRLEAVYFPETVTTIGPGAFEYCLNLRDVHLPESLVTIDFLAFRGCEKLASIELPSGLSTIGADAFMQCQSLSEATIPAGTAFIDYGIFAGCANLKAIHVAEGNTRFREEDGILYSYDMQTLLQYPNGKNESTIVIKDGVRRIERASIYENYTVEKIEFPDTLNSIGIYAFKDCHLLEKVELPRSVSKVEEHAFAYCYNLKEFVVNNAATSFGQAVFENDLDVVLRAPAGSVAESYASSQGIVFEALEESKEEAAEPTVTETPTAAAESSAGKKSEAVNNTQTVTAGPTNTSQPDSEKTTNPLLYVFILTAVLSLAGIIVVRRKLQEYE